MDRSNENIKTLLEKYWAGESSLEEEKIIYTYFKGSDIDPDLKEFVPFFNYFNSEKDITIDISAGILGKIENRGAETTTSEIDDLLEKYWAGESSLEDEQILHLYFNQSEVSLHHEELVAYFKYLKSERNIEIDVTDEVMQKIQKAPAQTKVIDMSWRKIISIAATIALIFSVGLGVFQYQQLKKSELTALDTYQTPEEALEQTKAALAYLSARMNRGTDKALDGLIKTETLEIINQ
jgi:hypothetical protein